MSNDPHSYRVPVLRVGDVFRSDDEKEKADPYGDSAVTGIGWTVAGDTTTATPQPARDNNAHADQDVPSSPPPTDTNAPAAPAPEQPPQTQAPQPLTADATTAPARPEARPPMQPVPPASSTEPQAAPKGPAVVESSAPNAAPSGAPVPATPRFAAPARASESAAPPTPPSRTPPALNTPATEAAHTNIPETPDAPQAVPTPPKTKPIDVAPLPAEEAEPAPATSRAATPMATDTPRPEQPGTAPAAPQETPAPAPPQEDPLAPLHTTAEAPEPTPPATTTAPSERAPTPNHSHTPTPHLGTTGQAPHAAATTEQPPAPDTHPTPEPTPATPTPALDTTAETPTPPRAPAPEVPPATPTPPATPVEAQSDTGEEAPDVWASIDPRPERVVHRATPTTAASPVPGASTPPLPETPEPPMNSDPATLPNHDEVSTNEPAPAPSTPAPHSAPITTEPEEAPKPSATPMRPTLDNPGEAPPDLWEQASAQVSAPTPTPTPPEHSAPEAQHNTPDTPAPGMTPRAAAYGAQQGSNLDALRQRVAVVQGEAAKAPAEPTASTARKSELARSNVQALQQGLAVLGDMPEQTNDAPHAHAIADVAQKLRTLRGDAATQQAAQERTTPQASPVPQGMGAPALMRTFKQDVEQAVGNHPNSIVQMVAAQQDAQAAAGAPTPARAGFSPGLYILLTLSMLLILGAVGIVAVLLTNGFFERDAPSMIQPSNTITYELDDHTRSEIMRDLVLVRDDAALQVGEIMNLSLTEEVYDATAGNDVAQQANTRTVFERLGFRAPDGLLRAVERPIMVGLVETESGTAPFIILQVQSYEFALAGMLNWEPALSGDVHPFFPNQPVPDGIAARTLSETPFTDRIVSNIPTRILETQERDVVLLWSIPDDRLVITTNERAFRLLWERLRL